jgi:hypothetical protein
VRSDARALWEVDDRAGHPIDKENDMTTKKRASAAVVTAVALAAVSAAVAAGAAPADNARSTASASAKPAFPEGVYRFKRSRRDILRVWPNADATTLQTHSGTLTFTFEHGSFSAVLAAGGVPDCRRGEGRYSANGQIVTARWTNFYRCPIFHAPSDPVRLQWAYDGENLRFRLAEPGRPTDRVTWESNTFVRIGGRP